MSITLTKRLDKGDKLTVVEHDTNLTDIENGVNGNETAVNSHISDKANPHEVTMTKLGFPLVQNIAPLDMPISTNMQNALDGIQLDLDTFKALKDNPHEVTMSQLGFPLVQNIAPLDMPISTAQGAVNTQLQNNIDGKENDLGNPTEDDMILSSKADGTRVWSNVNVALWKPNELLATSDTVTAFNFDFQNKPIPKGYTIKADRGFSINVENMLPDDFLSITVLIKTNSTISIQFPHWNFIMNASEDDTSQRPSFPFDGYSNDFKDGVQLTKNIIRAHEIILKKIYWDESFEINSSNVLKNGQDFYLFHTTASNGISFNKQ